MALQRMPNRTHARFTKKFVYIRHGQSTGNAMQFWRAADGVLTDKGESQAVTRVALMDAELLQKISQSELVLVSPLRRAMATSLIVAAEVMKRCQSEAASLTFFMKPSLCSNKAVESLPPSVVVDINLREKRKSGSEDPGCGWGDPLSYLEEIFDKYQEGLSTASLARFRAITDRMKRSYKRARIAATGEKTYRHNFPDCPDWDMPNGGRLPKDADAFADEIRVFKNEVLNYPDDNLLIVGHSGWARFSFAPWCAAEERKTAEENLRVGGIEGIRPLNNAGVVTGEIAHKIEARSDNFQVVHAGAAYTGAFQNVHIGEITPGDEEFPNTKSHPKVGIFNRMDEAKDAGMIPAASCFMNAYFEKQQQGIIGTDTAPRGGWEARTFVLSWYSGTAVLSWASKWAEPKGQLTLSGVEILVEDGITIVAATTNDCGEDSDGSVCKRIRMRIPEDFDMPLAEQKSAMVAWSALLQGYMEIEDPSVCP